MPTLSTGPPRKRPRAQPLRDEALALAPIPTTAETAAETTVPPVHEVQETTTVRHDPSPPADRHQAPRAPARPQPKTLPQDLRRLGNEKTWGDVLRHVTGSDRHKPIVVWGPTGCGKSMGVRSVLHAAGFKVLEVDGADAENKHQLVGWIRRVRKVKTMQGPTAVFLDDFESFTPDARRAAVEALADGWDDATLTPFVVTCTQLRDPSMRDLSRPLRTARPAHLRHMRLSAPSEHVIAEWFARTFRPAEVQAVRPLCLSGDLRRVRIALEWRRASQATLPGARAPPTRPITSNFDATRRLLLRRCSAEEWVRHAEDRDVDLLREHMPAHVGDDRDVLVQAMDAFSYADVCHPNQFELRELHASLPRLVAAGAARLTSRARDVGALAPPQILARAMDPGPESQPNQRPMPRSDWRDVPALLRDAP